MSDETNATWWVMSKTDERWNLEGRIFISDLSLFVPEKKVEELKEKYGDPPKDLIIGIAKD